MISYKIISSFSRLCQYILEKNVFSIFFIEKTTFYRKIYIANAMSVSVHLNRTSKTLRAVIFSVVKVAHRRRLVAVVETVTCQHADQSRGINRFDSDFPAGQIPAARIHQRGNRRAHCNPFAIGIEHADSRVKRARVTNQQFTRLRI